MIKLSTLIKAPKHITHAIEWREGKIAETQFPFRKSFRTGKKRWKVYDLEYDCINMKLLIIVDELKSNFRALFAIEVTGKGFVIAACLEEHSTHPGLHLHSYCDAWWELAIGVEKSGGHQYRLPSGKNHHRRSLLDYGKLLLTRETVDFEVRRFFNIISRGGFNDASAEQGTLF
jgi:hypothetical protein